MTRLEPDLSYAAPLGPAARQGNTAFATSVGLLMLRLVLGWIFIFHGSQKTFGLFEGPGLAKFSEGLAKLGLPGFLPVGVWGAMAAYGELTGGLCIFLGLFARLGAIPVIATMVVAIVTVHNKSFSGQGGYEFNLLIIAAAVMILVAGPGLISLDALLFKRGLWARGAQPLSDPVRRP